MKLWIGICIGIFIGMIFAGIILNSLWGNLLNDCQASKQEALEEWVSCEKECDEIVEDWKDLYYGGTSWRDDLLDDWEELYYDLLDDCYDIDYDYKDYDYNYPICSYNAYDCKDFQTWSEAQTVMEYCTAITKNNDIHYLDGDNDGVACEDLQ